MSFPGEKEDCSNAWSIPKIVTTKLLTTGTQVAQLP